MRRPLAQALARPLDPATRAWAGRWVPLLYLGVAAALIPWTVYLGLTLPQHHVISHYRAVWVGYDVVLILVLARIGWFAARRDPRVVLTATAGATLLVADAWFDVMTAATPGGRTGALLEAVLEAVLLELPGAVLCAVLARRGLAQLVARARSAGAAGAPTGVGSPSDSS
ncbi:hypothetical protein [Nocardioides sp. Iso805N]|uniref:hypothetical protein n=1 Tax=Nocardioides sp. Iso805N TaxID=1283287 RepID=UPI0003627999|nr:hypothetical protein [Nocardioides sp. Iso805N]